MNASEEVEEQEETILEYAEYHGLASNPFIDESLDGELASFQQLLEPLTNDDTTLYQIPRGALTFPEMRLTLDKKAALLLRDANQEFVDHDPWMEMAKACGPARNHVKKFDMPLLRTDPDADLAAFKARVRQPIHPDDELLPEEPLDDEKNQGLAWPSHMQSLSAVTMAELRKENLAFSQVSMLCFFNATKDDWTIEDDRNLLQREHTYTRGTVFDPVTPPLSPAFFPDYEPFTPSSPSLILPLLSDPASLLSTDLNTVEQKIFDKDKLVEDEDEYDASSLPEIRVDLGNTERRQHSKPHLLELESLPSDEHFPAIERYRKEDLVVDTGLTPPMPPLALSKTVTFSDEVETMLLDEYSDEGPSRAGSRNEGIIAWDASVNEVLKAASERTNNKLQHEQLQEAATTKKLLIPSIEFPELRLPWILAEVSCSREKSLEHQSNIILNALEASFIPAKVHGLHRLQENLRWAPFPTELAHVALSEDLDWKEDCESFLRASSNVTTSEDLTFKRDAPKCLAGPGYDDDDELGTAEFSEAEATQEDLNPILQKRKREVVDAMKDNSQATKRLKLDANGAKQQSSKSHRRVAENMVGSLMGAFDSYSATSALDNFMETRGKKKPKLTGSEHFAPKALQQERQPHQPRGPQATILQVPKSLVIPLPTVNPPVNPTPFIISTTLMQIRPVVKVIMSIYPTAQLIERDFSKHNESLWMKGSVKRSPMISPLASEADIILSPSVGLIIATLAKIKQKPLPGQKTKSKIIEKIEGVAQRYARVIVLVSEGTIDDTSKPLNGQDAMAYAEFAGFCGTHEAIVIPVYVPGGPNVLGSWIASAMVRNGIHDGSQGSLMEDETIWELFLRRCGMNAYAAQSIIAVMRPPVEVNSTNLNKIGMFGLSGFVQMDHAERVRQFSNLLGGTRVLERVSATIDTAWRPMTPLLPPASAPPPQCGNTTYSKSFL